MSCKTALLTESQSVKLSDEQSHASAKYLMARIKAVAKKGYAFGHQDATAYGIGWKNNGQQHKSDVNEVAGDFPGVFGFELGHLELGDAQNLDSVNFDLMRNLIKSAHEKGGIVTLSWHPDNPATLQSAWDPTPTVSYILEDGLLNPKYKGWLMKLASFMKEIKTKKGDPIPIVFRPYHEMNGGWFWWGNGNCTPSEFKQLWQETHTLLTKTLDVHNLIFCYATDAVEDEAEYLKFYPGDDYVDMLGIDLYHKRTTEAYVELLNDNLQMLSELGKQKNMPYALTEGGLEKIGIKDWWTNILDQNIADKGIAWALVWRNATLKHHYAPFKGQKSAEDFKKFKNLPHVIFLNELSEIK